MFQTPAPQEAEHDGSRSIALQVLLGPLAGRDDFDRVAHALGATSSDPVVEALWQRYSERAEALNQSQEEDLKRQEEVAEGKAKSSSEDPAAFEREVASYLGAVMAADEARGVLMSDTLADLAAARGVSAEDPRLVVASAQLAVARSAVPWRRFQLPWLLGPLWLAQADSLMLAAAITPDDPVVQSAVLAIAAAHAPTLKQAALDSRLAGFEALRDFITLVLRLQREGKTGGMDPSELTSLPAAKTLIRRLQDAAALRTEAQLAFLAALEPILGPERAAKLRASYAEQTFPEFFAELPWRADARAFADSVASSRGGSGTRAGHAAASAARWRELDAEMIVRLLEWQRSPTSVAPPLRPQDLAPLSLEDGDLGALRFLRDENALRLLRDAALAAGQPPNGRMAGALRSVSRPMMNLGQ